MIVAMSRVMAADPAGTFFDLYQRESTTVLRYLRSTLRDEAAAEDLCADTFFKAWNAWGRFRGNDAEARAWVMRIARNLVIDNVRRDGRVKFSPLTDAATAVALPADAEMMDLRNAMDHLGRDDRELLAMRIAGLSHAEIARVQKKSEAAVKKAWQRALVKLRAHLEVRA
jgi:RNA polymerase sigma-70 factor (ECF subfamily)